MFDWFLSKIGLMVFIAILAALVFSFSAFQINFLNTGNSVQAANTLVKIIDSVCENCSITYQMAGNYTIGIKEKNLTVQNVFRGFLSTANPGQFKADKIKVYKEDGIVYVVKA
ncbi:MAG TPA: hypothetical protein VJB06_02570 [archaeon]|nr:hypothetical protein [archaeon]